MLDSRLTGSSSVRNPSNAGCVVTINDDMSYFVYTLIVATTGSCSYTLFLEKNTRTRRSSGDTLPGVCDDGSSACGLRCP